MSSDKIKRKIELLLAKAEGTDNEHERDAFTAQAERLMLKWGIESADLEARGEIKPEEIVEERLVFNGIWSKSMPAFIHSIALGMGNVRVLKSGSGNRWFVYVIGHKTDVANFITLTNSLVQQVTTARTRWWKNSLERQYITNGWDAHKEQREFVFAFGRIVGQRLRDQRAEVQAEATPGAALVLVSKEERVNDWVDNTYSRLRQAKNLTGGSGNGRVAGHRAGLQANLGEKSIGGGTAGALQ